MRYFLSRKKQELVIFVKEEFLHKKIQKKKRCFWIFLTTNSLTLGMKVGSVKQYVLWRLVKATRSLKSLIKFTHNIFRECLLDFCRIFCNLNQFSKTCS